MQNIQNGNIVSIQVGPLCCDNEVMMKFMYPSISYSAMLATFMTIYADIYILRQMASYLKLYGTVNMELLPTKTANITI